MNGSGVESHAVSSLSSGAAFKEILRPPKLAVIVGCDSHKPYVSLACAQSIKRFVPPGFSIQIMDTELLRRAGVYCRKKETRGRQSYDAIDGKPFSTDFSFSRFLIPTLFGQRDGWVVFCDDDFLWRASIEGLIPLLDETKAVMVVKHNHSPETGVKMDGRIQQPYRRKNWSSMVAWNLAHPSNRSLTAEVVNTAHGSWLHGFEWLQDDEIGSLPEKWNWLEGHSPKDIDPIGVHYTRGGPWLSAYRDSAYASEWLDVHFLSLNEVAEEYHARRSVFLAFWG